MQNEQLNWTFTALSNAEAGLTYPVIVQPIVQPLIFTNPSYLTSTVVSNPPNPCSSNDCSCCGSCPRFTYRPYC